MKYPQLVSMPSAISNWLEEQLEARGIDALVYTRYILSLLDSDAVDVINPDEDLQLSHWKKESKRSGGNRKRFRRSSDWWRYGQLDADRIKRSAAVDCLMSASEQTCGIESLIDELCDKIKKIKTDSDAPLPTSVVVDSPPVASVKISELQRVSPHELAKRYYAAFPPLDRNLSATAASSPSKLINLIPKWIQSPNKSSSTTNRHAVTNPKALTYQKTWNGGKNQRFNYYLDHSNNTKHCHNNMNTPAKKPTKQQEKTRMENFANIQKWLEDSALVMNEEERSSSEEDSFELPVDLDLLLASPVPENAVPERVEDPLLEEACREFLQRRTRESACHLSFSVRSPPMGERDPDDPFHANSQREGTNKWHDNVKIGVEWSEESGYYNDGLLLGQRQRSLFALNHDLESSPFVQVPVHAGAGTSSPRSTFSRCVQPPPKPNIILTDIDDADKDDLLISDFTHFRPIRDRIERGQGEYSDGTTFPISRELETVSYRRTESGAMYLESDYAMRREYREVQENTPSSHVDPNAFSLKYVVSQNNKECQTEVAADSKKEGGAAAANVYELFPSLRKKCNCKTVLGCTCDAAGAPKPKPQATNPDYSYGDNKMNARKICIKCHKMFIQKEDNFVFHGWSFNNYMHDIWRTTEICVDCQEIPRPTPNTEKLREEVHELGDQILSDLSIIGSAEVEVFDFHTTLVELIEEARRNTSRMAEPSDAQDDWSFAARIENDCIMNMSALQTLRSVTL